MTPPTASAPPRMTGFTLIEVLVVVVILGILAALVVPKITSRPDTARIARVHLDLHNIDAALALYHLDNGRYPTQAQGLAALVKQPTVPPIPNDWHPYLNAIPKDPWGIPYHYRIPGEHDQPYDIYTLGADNTPGGTGINATRGNWDDETTDPH